MTARRRTSGATLLALLLGSVLALGVDPAARAAEPGDPAGVADVAEVAAAPATIPALRQWTPAADAAFSLGAAPRVVVPAVAGLPTARIIAQQLADVTGVPHRAAVGAPRPGDISLVRSGESALGAEGYRLRIGLVAEVTAPTDAGLFYGGQSLVQLLRQGPGIPAGTAVDGPRYPERGYMLDMGRRHFDLQFLKRQVREMSYLKLNLLHLHLSDNIGFRIESTRHPEITSPEHLTKAEVRELVAYAKARHVLVVPEIDMPGHMGAILAQHPELQLANVLGSKSPERLDVANPAAVAFARDIIAEFLPLFPGKYWHLGADEYMPLVEYLLHPALAAYAKTKYGASNAKDAVLGFVNEMASFLRGRGKVVRVWNDELGGGKNVTPDPRLVVEWWTDFSPISGVLLPTAPQVLIDRGHAVLNNGWWPTYDTLGPVPNADMAEAYDDWSVHRFHGVLHYDSTVQTPPHLVAPAEPRNLGTKLALWMDNRDQTDTEIEASVLPRLRVIGQKAWESPLPGDYARFLEIADLVGRAP